VLSARAALLCSEEVLLTPPGSWIFSYENDYTQNPAFVKVMDGFTIVDYKAGISQEKSHLKLKGD